MRIKLDKEDCIEIARVISDNFDRESICSEVCGLEIQIDYSLEKLGYIEDDYDNGTGAFICAEIDFDLFSIEATNIDAEIDFSLKQIENELRKMLID